MAPGKGFPENSKRKKQIQGENMAFSINTNIASLQAQEYLRVGSDFQSKTINRVTSGLRIINSGDDAAGLAIANGFRSDRAVLMQGVRNANDGLSTLQTIDGGINNISQLLDRARTLAAQSASGTFTGSRSLLDSEFQSVVTEIDRQAKAIGLNSGGDFNRNLSVFIGGGRGSDDAAVISNGSVSVDLSSSVVDSKGLGLSAFRAKGNADLSGTNTTTLLNSATSISLRFMGAGFGETDTDVITVSVNTNGVDSAQGLADAINAAIDGYAATSVYGERFQNAGITASVSSDGKYLQFDSSVTAFQVIGNSTEADAVIGTDDRIYSSGVQYTTVSYTTLAQSTDQNVSFSVVDASGELHTLSVNLLDAAAGGMTADEAVQAINAALYNSNDTALQSIVAVADEDTGVNIRFMSTAPEFSVTVSVPEGGATQGLNAGVFAKKDSEADTTNSSSLSIATSALAEAAVTALGNAVSALGDAQAVVGKGQNTFNYAVSLAQTQLSNLAAAESRIRDADLAMEAANLTKAQVLQQAGIAALAQANAAPQAVLSLLRG
jgi:flagellin